MRNTKYEDCFANTLLIRSSAVWRRWLIPWLESLRRNGDGLKLTCLFPYQSSLSWLELLGLQFLSAELHRTIGTQSCVNNCFTRNYCKTKLKTFDEQSFIHTIIIKGTVLLTLTKDNWNGLSGYRHRSMHNFYSWLLNKNKKRHYDNNTWKWQRRVKPTEYRLHQLFLRYHGISVINPWPGRRHSSFDLSWMN